MCSSLRFFSFFFFFFFFSVHRDLKLENCLVSKDGTCKVSDFGTTTVSSYTMTQQVIGTIHILAPEVARHEKYDERVDVYSFGISAAEFLSCSSFHRELRSQVDYDFQVLTSR
jgi:serine/threonine protein kinase